MVIGIDTIGTPTILPEEGMLRVSDRTTWIGTDLIDSSRYAHAPMARLAAGNLRIVAAPDMRLRIPYRSTSISDGNGAHGGVSIRNTLGMVFYLVNTSDSIVCVSLQDGMLPSILEAQDEHETWRPIEFWTYSWCGNSYGSVRIHPEEVMTVRMRRYEGSFHTKLRVRVQLDRGAPITSDQFNGWIDPGQLHQYVERPLGPSYLDEE